MSMRCFHCRRFTISRHATLFYLTALAITALLLGHAQLTHGQANQTDAAGNATAELDIEAFIYSNDVRVAETSFAIWKIHPNPGASLILIPINFTPGDNPTMLNQSTIKLQGGRFLVWRLGENRDAAPPSSLAAKKIEEALPNDVPIFTRRATLNPNGRVEWSLDRVIPNGTVMESQRDYALLLNRDLLEKNSPGDKPNLTKNKDEPTRDFNLRRLEAMRTYREQFKEYLALRNRVFDLETKFEARMPHRVWAVFEVRPHNKQITISNVAAGPWSITFDQYDSLHRAANHELTIPQADQHLVEATQIHISRLLGMLEGPLKEHPYTWRAVALALTGSTLIPQAREGDVVYRTVEALVNGPDTFARGLMYQKITKGAVLNPALRKLARDQIASADPAAKVALLSGVLSGSSDDPDAQQRNMQQVNAMLAASDGPPVDMILQQLIESDASRNMAQRVRFDQVQGPRRDEAIAYVLSHADEHEVADFWLNQSLLGSTDSTLVFRTLELIAAAQTTRTVRSPMIENMLDLWLTRSESQTASSQVPVVVLDKPLVVRSSSHGIFRAIQASDPRVAALGWRALPRFTLEPGKDESGNAIEAGLYRTIISAAIARQRTPETIVGFLENRLDRPYTIPGLVQIAISGTQPASTRAAQVVFDSKYELLSLLQNFGPVERQAFANAVYRAKTNQTPMVTALLRQQADTSGLLPWFADQLQQGILPSASKWLESAGGEARMLDLVAASDVELAQGAVAALVASVGGDDRFVSGATQQLRGSRGRQQLELDWKNIRSAIYNKRIEQAAGRREMIVTTYTEHFQKITTETAPRETLSIGIIEVKVQNNTITLGLPDITVVRPEGELLIRLPEPSQLRSLPHDRLEYMVPDGIVNPLDLQPGSDDIWRGYVQAGTDNTVGIELRPITQ